MNTHKPKPKILVILGPTASGKSDLAVELALKYNGEVISADSRQVYKGLDIGTGKITKREMRGIPHHMLDVASAKKVFTAQEYKNQGQKIIADMLSRNKLPIICGGTGFYIQALVDNISFPEVAPNQILRKKLGTKTADTLFKILEKLDLDRAKTIDRKNPVRLIRAIEIATALGKVPSLPTQKDIKKNRAYDILQIGTKIPDPILKQRIRDRLLKRMGAGMLAEVQTLHKGGLSYKRMNELGLEYRYLALYLQKIISKEEMLKQLESEIWHYAKRQRQWFKRDKTILWLPPTSHKEIRLFIENFLTEH